MHQLLRAIPPLTTSSSAAEAFASVVGSAGSFAGLQGCWAHHHHTSDINTISSSNTILAAGKSRGQPQEAGTCAAADAEVAASGASSVSAA
eukprot:766779-Pleurochrysis_carterae.AAC.1